MLGKGTHDPSLNPNAYPMTDEVRFPSAVPVGSRIRARCKVLAVEDVKNSLQLTEEYSVEIEGQSRPACVAECVMRLYF